MSVKIMGMVWDADLPRDKKFILLAYADHAQHDGTRIFPSIPLIAWKTGYSERQVQRVTHELVTDRILISVGVSSLGTNEFVIDIDALPPRCQRVGTRRGRPAGAVGGDTASPILPSGGDTTSPDIEQTGDLTKLIGDIPNKIGDILTNNGDMAMAPESSFKPSINRNGNRSQNIWIQVLCQMQINLGPRGKPSYDRYFSHTYLDTRDGEVFTVAVNSEDQKAWLENRAKTTIEKILIGAAKTNHPTVLFKVVTNGAGPDRN